MKLRPPPIAPAGMLSSTNLMNLFYKNKILGEKSSLLLFWMKALPAGPLWESEFLSLDLRATFANGIGEGVLDNRIPCHPGTVLSIYRE